VCVFCRNFFICFILVGWILFFLIFYSFIYFFLLFVVTRAWRNEAENGQKRNVCFEFEVEKLPGYLWFTRLLPLMHMFPRTNCVHKQTWIILAIFDSTHNFVRGIARGTHTFKKLCVRTWSPTSIALPSVVANRPKFAPRG